MELSYEDLLKLVVVVSERVDIRGVVREALKDIGAKNVINLANLDELLEFLGKTKEIPGWIFTTLDESQDVNWVNFLAAKIETHELKKTLVTVMINAEQESELPLAYELGVVSHLKIPFTHNDIVNKLNAVIDNGERCHWNLAEVAADYFREYLNDNNLFAELVKLEQSLVDRFPGKPHYLVKLAEAEYANDNKVRAKKIINRATMLGGNVKAAAQQLQDLITADQATEDSANPEFADAFEVKTCMIVDSDASARNLTKESLTELGITEFIEAENGKEAFEKFDFSNPPDLVLTEWKMPILGGMQFVQRIVHGLKKEVIIVITSSNIKKEDVPIIKEMRISGHIPKPIASQELHALIVNLVTASKTSREAETVYNKIHLAIRNEDKSEALKLYGTYQCLENRDPITDLLVEAEINYLKGFYDEAKKNAFAAFSQSGGNLAAGSLITKILLKLKQPLEAMKTMDWLQTMSPNNLERICTLAEMHSEMGHNEIANEHIASAKKIDLNAPITMETTARVALNSGDTQTVKNVLENMDSLAPLITYMNNRAVMLVRNGEVDTGIKLYKDALNSLPSGRSKEQCAIHYNLGLAFARTNHLQDAAEELSKIKEGDHPRLYEKAVKLKKNIDVAINKGMKLNFHNQTEAIITPNQFTMPIPCGLPGDLGLHLVYSSQRLESDEIQNLLKNLKRISYQK